MPRFFVKPDQVDDTSIVITGNDVNHIKNVLRMRCGEEVSVSDGQGKDYFCTIESLDKDQVCLHIENSWDSYVELPAKLYLFQGLPKGDKMDLIVQKAVELGVFEIIPVVTARTIVHLDPKKAPKKVERWQSLCESAAKQSGRGIIPTVAPVTSFKDALNRASHMDAVIMPYEQAKGMDAARKAVREMNNKKNIGIFIGPEGGFDPSEVSMAQEAGAVPMTLGKRILRTETAGLAVLSILMFELEDN
ncbi:16S rRNA (uracil1498-N3)-methyltransferase [Catenibacillus scindens]|uniref:Ribosomal RNA small subunit methyltransferase E n=1 Tax=Catenibacillus scindens TaxID=673271 RepID=A0A7W8H9S8_9FIRM|nr:16S rRNA (uracil(1498)-N(3))-methyltransferase [Catenibacillus scindens]MBB5264526.1 16S rRNA (uracil1498-N3)-methyltransferase [Catenibacillus scindens]